MHLGTVMTLVYKRILGGSFNADRERHVFQNGVVNNMAASAMQDYYSSKIQENSGSTGILFKTIEKLLSSNPVQRYPFDTDNLSESFVDFFTKKLPEFAMILTRFLEFRMAALLHHVVLKPIPVWPVSLFVNSGWLMRK